MRISGRQRAEKMKSKCIQNRKSNVNMEMKKIHINVVHGPFIKTINSIASVNHSPIITNITSSELIFMEKSECEWPNGFI